MAECTIPESTAYIHMWFSLIGAITIAIGINLLVLSIGYGLAKLLQRWCEKVEKIENHWTHHIGDWLDKK